MRVKFHYTQSGFAALILAEQTYRVSAERGRAGHGLYARAVCTSVAPGAMSDDAPLALLFTCPRPRLHVEGVVVLRNDAFVWEQYEPRKYVHRTAPAANLDLSLVLVGIGTRRGGGWAWSDGVFA